MKQLLLIGLYFFSAISLSQSDKWVMSEMEKGLKFKLPSEPEKRYVRDMNLNEIETGNYSWKIISMPYSTFVKDKEDLNFLGQAKNISNQLKSDPHATLIEEKEFLINGHPAYYSYLDNLNLMDTTQNFKSIQFFLKFNEKVYVSNLKIYKESDVKFPEFKLFIENIKIAKKKEADSLITKGEKTYFEISNKKSFLKGTYCNLPKIERTKSYHKLLSMEVTFYLTESGLVSAVSLESAKMVLITRESEERLKSFFSKFKFTKVEKDTKNENPKFDFRLIMTKSAFKAICE